MRSLNLALLCLLALLLAAGNVWLAAARSTIPLELNETLERIEMRREKHPGKDDVYLISLQSGRVIQIDPAVAQALEPGDKIRKQPWQRDLLADQRTIRLDWSPDARGMVVAMPLVLLIVLATALWAGSWEQA